MNNQDLELPFPVMDPVMEQGLQQQDVSQLYGTPGDQVKLVQEYLEDNKIPREDKIVKEFWGILSKFQSLSFNEPEDNEVLIHDFEAEILNFLSSIPEDEYTFQVRQIIGNIRMIFLANLRRSVGTKTNKVNERTLQNTQIRQTFGVQVQHRRGESGNFFGRVRERLGR
jgi:hypothetical protein